MSKLIYDYTSGYPAFASIICKLMNENNAVSKPKSWTPEGFLLIEKKIYDKKVSLFGSLINKMENSRELRNFVYSELFKSKKRSRFDFIKKK